MVEPRHQPCFAQCLFDTLCIHRRCIDHLDGDIDIEGVVMSAVHRAECAAAQHLAGS